VGLNEDRAKRKLLEDESDDLATEIRLLTNVNIVIDKLNFVDIIRDGDFFTIKNTTIPVNKFVTKSSAVINSSLMSALKSIGLSTNAIIELINAYSYQIDFQRQIQSGDTVTVITEKFMTKDGEFSHHGKILYASLTLSGKEYNIYRYKHDNVADGFFSEEGKSVKRSLLKTPVNVMRISSQYGKRLHPVDGYTKMHRGVDFSAPEGTPIYAAGDGVITELGWKSGYGRWIQIKHSATLSTAYAHSKSFAKNMKVGSKVKQGQIIAYVGRSGKTTGAHLHYEVKIDGRHVNPMSIKTTPGIELAGNTLEKFQKFKTKFQKLSAKLDQKVEIAENEMLALN
jgi:murein DD-endopeptidase MepM/ murein hydrolase activator NlpD